MIYDTFLFSNEVELLKLRLTELWDVVDRFVLVESRENHRGGTKPLYYEENRSEFERWNSKIVPLVIQSFSIIGDNVRSNGERERLARMALDHFPFDENSMIVYGDADEIVKPHIIHEYRDCIDLKWCEMKFYHYFFNCLEAPTPPGARPVIAPARLFKDIGFEAARWTHGFSETSKAPMIPNAGWHFSYMGNVDALKEKISWAVEGGSSDWVFIEDPILIQSRIDSGMPYNGGKQFSFVAIDETMPQYVRDNTESLTYKGLIKPL